MEKKKRKIIKSRETRESSLQGKTGRALSVKHCSKKRYFHHPREETHTLDRRKGGNFFFQVSEQDRALV